LHRHCYNTHRRCWHRDITASPELYQCQHISSAVRSDFQFITDICVTTSKLSNICRPACVHLGIGRLVLTRACLVHQHCRPCIPACERLLESTRISVFLLQEPADPGVSKPSKHLGNCSRRPWLSFRDQSSESINTRHTRRYSLTNPRCIRSAASI
jgi:hypothetical protein